MRKLAVPDLPDLAYEVNPVLAVLKPYLYWEVIPPDQAYRSLIAEVKEAILSLHDEPDDEMLDYADTLSERIVDALYSGDFDYVKELIAEVML